MDEAKRGVEDTLRGLRPGNGKEFAEEVSRDLQELMDVVADKLVDIVRKHPVGYQELSRMNIDTLPSMDSILKPRPGVDPLTAFIDEARASTSNMKMSNEARACLEDIYSLIASVPVLLEEKESFTKKGGKKPAPPEFPVSVEVPADFSLNIEKVREQQLFEKTFSNTQGIVRARLKKNLDEGFLAAEDGSRFSTENVRGGIFSGFGLFGKGVQDVKFDQADASNAAAGRLAEEAKTLKEIGKRGVSSMDELRAMRGRLGLPEIPASEVSDFEQVKDMARRAAEKADPSLRVDYRALNDSLERSVRVLDNWEEAIQTFDEGMSFAAGFVPYGSEVYALSRNAGDVVAGTKSPQEAAASFFLDVVAARVGSKVASALPLEKAAKSWAQKNAKYFSKKGSEAMVKWVSSKGADVIAGAVEGGVESTVKDAPDVIAGGKTFKDAGMDVGNEVVKGAMKGALKA